MNGYKIVKGDATNDLFDVLIQLQSGAYKPLVSSIEPIAFIEGNWEKGIKPLSSIVKGVPSTESPMVNYLTMNSLYSNGPYYLIPRDKCSPLIIETGTNNSSGFTIDEMEVSCIMENVSFDVEPSETDKLIGGLLNLILMSKIVDDNMKAAFVSNCNRALSPPEIEEQHSWSLRNYGILMNILSTHSVNDFDWSTEIKFLPLLVSTNFKAEGELAC